jgi:hypothetical protein
LKGFAKMLFPFMHFADVSNYAGFDLGITFLIKHPHEDGVRECGFCIPLGFVMVFFGIGYDPNA